MEEGKIVGGVGGVGSWIGGLVFRWRAIGVRARGSGYERRGRGFFEGFFRLLYFLLLLEESSGFAIGVSVFLFGGRRLVRMAEVSGRRSGRARVAPSRLVDDDAGDPFLDPPVGRMFMIQSCCLGAVGDVFLRLPGCREGTGQPRYRMMPSSRPEQSDAEGCP